MRGLATLLGERVGSARSRLLRCLMLVLFCALAFLPGAATLPPVDRDEARFAQASRQMLETGDFVDIRFQEEPRYKKPVGIHWLQAAAASAFGAVDEIWAYRVPSFLGATAAVILTALLGAALFDATSGMVAAVMLASALLLGVEARLATTDAVLLATIVAAQAALALLWLPREDAPARRWAAPCFWTALGLGVLVKGPIILVVVAATLVCLHFCRRDRATRWLRRLRPGFGILLLLAIVAPWGVAISLASRGTFFQGSLGHDFLSKILAGQESHGFPPGYHLALFWVGFWPFAPLAALAAPWVWGQRREPAVVFCLAWLLPAWLIFELVPTKLPHYVLPLYPAAALLAARALLQPPAPSARPAWALWLAAAGVLGGIGLGLLPLGAGWYLEDRLSPAAVLAALAITTTSLAVFGLARRERIVSTLMVGAVGAIVSSALTFQLLLPSIEALWPSRRAAAAVEAARPCLQTVLAAAGYAEPSLVFLAGTRTRLVDGGAAGRRLLAENGCGLALVEAAEEAAFASALERAGAGAEAIAAIEGVDYSNGRIVRLNLYRLRDPRAAP